MRDDEAVGPTACGSYFGEERVVSDGGGTLLATLAPHLGVEASAQRSVPVQGHRQPRQECAAMMIALIYPMVLGVDSIDDCEVLCAGGRGGCSGASRRARRCTSACAKGPANTQTGIARSTEELIARVTRAGATGIKLFGRLVVLEHAAVALLDWGADAQLRPRGRRSDRRGCPAAHRLPPRKLRHRSPRPPMAAGS